jgi:hypothetical protein
MIWDGAATVRERESLGQLSRSLTVAVLLAAFRHGLGKRGLDGDAPSSGQGILVK